MRRLFWLTVGGTLGAIGMRKATKAANRAATRLTPAGVSATLTDTAARAVAGAREFVREVKDSAATRELELTESTGLDGRLGARPEDFEVGRR